jgi:uncharacterized protein
VFVGRNEELAQLARVKDLKKASLIVCRGRRRIGKSTLIEQFGQSVRRFLEFQGLAPREQLGNTDQLASFSQQLAAQIGLPPLLLRNWGEAFSLLARETEEGEVLIFLDEISWMAAHDRDFVGQLKIIWDTKLKKNPDLILVLCGSVSSWIDRNILNSADFMGRVSLTLNLQELPLHQCHHFWGKNRNRISSSEKFRILSITGGIPRYLEEVDYQNSAGQNITDLCFNPSGILFNEFEKIFHDIFSRRSKTYKEIVLSLVEGPRAFSQICDRLKAPPNGVISDYLADLETSGFVKREYVYSPKTTRKGKLSRYRLSDNYLRFYLHYIEPEKDRIRSGLWHDMKVEDLASYDSIMGLQLENLILNNLAQVLQHLNIQPRHVLSASPYFQRQTARQQACQIDLLINTRRTLCVGEIKFCREIGSEIIAPMNEKVRRLKYDRNKTLRLVLIHAGQVAQPLIDSNFFDAILPFERLLETSIRAT